MIYFFLNEDRSKSQKKAQKLFLDLQKKKLDASFLLFSDLDLEKINFDELCFTSGLFEQKLVVFISSIDTNKEILSLFVSNLKQIKESQTIFIVTAEKLLKGDKEKIEKNSEKFFFEEKKDKKEELNVFKITEAFGKRDKREMWKLFLELKDNVPAEEIHGILWWQLKSMILVLKTNTPEEADLKPFVYSKAKSFLKNYSETEINKLQKEFVSMYHEAHRGTFNLYDRLEYVILGL